MATTIGKDAVIRFVQETVAGTTPTNPALQLFSKETLRATLGLDVNQQESLDMGNVDVEEYFKVQNAYTVEVECHIYDAQRILDFMTRLVDNGLKPYTLEYIPDQSATTKHYFRGTGWRVESVDIQGSAGDPYVATIKFKGGKFADPVTVDPGIGTGSREAKSAITDPIKVFSTAAITLDGTAWAVILNSFGVTVENDFEVHYTTGDADPVVTLAQGATRRITGTGDISFDNGASTEWLRTKNFTAHTIILPFGATGQEQLTLTGSRFPSIEVESNVDDDLLMGNRDFVSASLTVGLVP